MKLKHIFCKIIPFSKIDIEFPITSNYAKLLLVLYANFYRKIKIPLSNYQINKFINWNLAREIADSNVKLIFIFDSRGELINDLEQLVAVRLRGDTEITGYFPLFGKVPSDV